MTIIGEIKIQVEDVKRKGTLTELKLNITDPEGQGDVTLSMWSKNPKTKVTTIQINSVKGNERRLIKVFALEVVKDLIEKTSNGQPIEELFQKGDAKVVCPVCNKVFAKEATLKTHMKSHVICHKCDMCFKKESELKKHEDSVHISDSKSENALTEDKSNICEDCGHIAKTRKALMVHKEKEHIEDSWLASTKREQNMMTSEKESNNTKTQEPHLKRVKKTDTESEEELKKVSDDMDEKVLKKRKLVEEMELNWQKEKEKGENLKKKN